MKDKDKKELSKGSSFWYNVMPWVFTVLSLIFSIVVCYVKRIDLNGKNDFYYYTQITSVFDGNPNVIALLGIILMIPCILIIPISMMKKRKSGDGLGLMFMPLGLLGIFVVLSTIENAKDHVLGISFGVVLFVISALGTFRKTIKYVNLLCIVMMIVALYFLLAGYMPYCYSKLPRYLLSYETLEYKTGAYYYLSYFIRDLFLLAAYGVFSSKIARKYKELDEKEKKKK